MDTVVMEIGMRVQNAAAITVVMHRMPALPSKRTGVSFQVVKIF